MHRDPDDRGRGQRARVSAQTRRATTDEAQEAKRKLEELFGGPKAARDTPPPAARSSSTAPRRSTGQVFASPRKSTGRTPTDYRLRLERLRIARDPEEIRIATDRFLEHHQLPDEVDILYKVLQHPSEKIVREALGQISSLLMQGRLAATLILRDRLGELAGRVEEEATRSYIDGLRSQLGALEEKG